MTREEHAKFLAQCKEFVLGMTRLEQRTWQNAVELGKTEEFHVNYETAVDKVRSEFGQTLPMIIDGKEVRTTATFPDVSPADIRVVLGLFQHGTKAHAKRAIKAARAA